MSSRCTGTYVPGISFASDNHTIQVDITNMLDVCFTSVFSSSNSDHFCKLLKEDIEALMLNFASWPAEPYNAEFYIDELLAVPQPSHNVTPGLDSIHDQMFTHLPPRGRKFLLSMCNYIWSENSVPAASTVAMVVLVLKPGRDCSLPCSCRPVSY
jgi:hypothetical protein